MDKFSIETLEGNYPDGPARRVTLNFKQDVPAGTELVFDILWNGKIVEVSTASNNGAKE